MASSWASVGVEEDDDGEDVVVVAVVVEEEEEGSGLGLAFGFLAIPVCWCCEGGEVGLE